MGRTPGARAVLDYWFGALNAGLADEAHRRRWFQGGAALDREIRDRFGPLIEAAVGGELDSWLESPTGTVAFVLVCDQFPRHVHRGTAAAFATDPLALEVARSAIDRGRDRSLALDERAFLYLPFEHSESAVDQHTAVGLFSKLRDDTPQGYRHLTGAYLQHAHQHRDVVLRFGRFPHRNRLLERGSTAEEQAFLDTASGFGQTAEPIDDNRDRDPGKD